MSALTPKTLSPKLQKCQDTNARSAALLQTKMETLIPVVQAELFDAAFNE
jgi:hypothetical protein